MTAWDTAWYHRYILMWRQCAVCYNYLAKFILFRTYTLLLMTKWQIFVVVINYCWVINDLACIQSGEDSLVLTTRTWYVMSGSRSLFCSRTFNLLIQLLCICAFCSLHHTCILVHPCLKFKADTDHCIFWIMYCGLLWILHLLDITIMVVYRNL